MMIISLNHLYHEIKNTSCRHACRMQPYLYVTALLKYIFNILYSFGRMALARSNANIPSPIMNFNFFFNFLLDCFLFTIPYLQIN